MYNQDESTSKRISFQSIFSSLCTLYQDKFDFSQIEDMANNINDRLHQKYPAEQLNQKPMQTNYQVKSFSDLPVGRGKICPVPNCGSPMIRQTQKKNPKAPDWKCSNKNCKYTKMMGGGWKKSDYITGVWDEKEEDINRANTEDVILEEANQQSYDDREYPNYNERN